MELVEILQVEESSSFFSGLMRGIRELIQSSKDHDWYGVTYNMMLIGESGSGKTSFLNLMCNFREILKLKEDTPVHIKTVHTFHDEKLENPSRTHEMESATTGSTYYKLDFNGVTIGILDTPGFGDTRGLDVDKENVKKIVDKVNDVEYINCVCLIINGRHSRLTHQLQYVVSEISAVLPKVTSTNTIVVFTNASEQFDVSFEVNQLTPYLGHKLSEKNVFYIDNPYCKLQKMQRSNVTKDLKEAFRQTSESLEKMFNRIKSFGQIHTTFFMDLYWSKEAVENTVHKLLLAAQNKTSLEETIMKKKTEIDEAIARRSFNQDFQRSIKVPKMVMQTTQQHNTTCEECNSNCHPSCGLNLTVDRENLRNCSCMAADRSTCRECGHGYFMHKHAMYMIVRTEEEITIVNEDMKKKFESAELDIVTLGSEMKDALDKKIPEMEKEVGYLLENLQNKVQSFESRASIPSYLKLLECQLLVVKQRIQHMSGDGSGGVEYLMKTQEQLERKIAIVNARDQTNST